MKTERYHLDADRYLFDFDRCNHKAGWAQLDTRQDASYYGNWINPVTLEIVSYCEGDVTHHRCETEDAFKTELRSMLDWHHKAEYAPKIDGMCNPAIIDALSAFGFSADLH